MTLELRVLRFDGMHPDTLGHYFSALGLLAAVAQRWPSVRGCWRNRRFVLLHKSLTEPEVKDYLLNVWQPIRYERWWGEAQSSKDDGSLWAERNQRSLTEINVMEAQLVGTKRTHFNPVFGNGGIVGRRDFARVWTKCFEKVRPSRKTRKSKEASSNPAKSRRSAKLARKTKSQLAIESYLDAALKGYATVELPTLKSTGTWFTFANKLSNSGQNWFREGQLSPWSLLLATEGALLLVGDVNRRLSIRARPYAVFPFVCDPAQPTVPGEVGMSKGEFWAPLWNFPATIIEVHELFKRGLARIGNRSAHAPHEFAISALAAGTDSGIEEFVRFDLRQTTSAETQEAVPREHIRVGGDGVSASKLLLEIDGWLRSLGRFDDNRGKGFHGLLGPVESAIIRISERPDDAERWQDLLLLLSRQQARIDRNKSFREKFPPLPWLRPNWFIRAWPGHLHRPEEILLARAIASIGAGTNYPLLMNIYGIELRARRILKFTEGDRPPRVVWNEGAPLRLLGQLLHYRLLDGPKRARHSDDSIDFRFLTGMHKISMSIVAELLQHELDMDLVARWVPALALIDWRNDRSSGRDDLFLHTGETLLLSLLRPIFHHNPLRVLDWLPPGTDWPPKPALARRILNMSQFGNLEGAIQAASSYYQAAGRSVVELPRHLPLNNDFPTRLMASLLIPLSNDGIQRGLSRWLVPEKVNPK